MIKPLVLKAIRLYQLTRSLRAPACRFYPSCSDYAYESIQRHGICCGAALSIWRVLRCQPLHPGGVDVVPDKLSAPSWLVQSHPTKI